LAQLQPKAAYSSVKMTSIGIASGCNTATLARVARSYAVQTMNSHVFPAADFERLLTSGGDTSGPIDNLLNSGYITHYDSAGFATAGLN
jgi:hypothetical protein